MSDKHLVVQGATLQCKYGTMPDKLVVKTQSRHYTNDKDAKSKLTATDKDLGQTLEKNSFGLCKLQPLPGGGYKPCQAVITKWSGAYEKVTIEDNGGHVLTEDSKATCPIGGPDCISITNHGQTAELSQQNIDNARPEVLTSLLPFVKLKEEEKPKIYFKPE